MAIKDRSDNTNKLIEKQNNYEGFIAARPFQEKEHEQFAIGRFRSSSSRKEKPTVFAGPQQIVYEGGNVQLEGFCNLDQDQDQPNKDIVYDWFFVKEASDTTLPQEEFRDMKYPDFVAPYVEFQPITDTAKESGQTERSIQTVKYKTSSKLVFKLIATDMSTNLKSDPSFVTIIVKMVQRALVLQGGGALGAYEIGAYKAL